jgi:hypothetical protein
MNRNMDGTWRPQFTTTRRPVQVPLRTSFVSLSGTSAPSSSNNRNLTMRRFLTSGWLHLLHTQPDCSRQFLLMPNPFSGTWAALTRTGHLHMLHIPEIVACMINEPTSKSNNCYSQLLSCLHYDHYPSPVSCDRSEVTDTPGSFLTSILPSLWGNGYPRINHHLCPVIGLR